MIMNAEKEMKIGLFVGSFDPFTLGHDSIVRRALPLFDKNCDWYRCKRAQTIHANN